MWKIIKSELIYKLLTEVGGLRDIVSSQQEVLSSLMGDVKQLQITVEDLKKSGGKHK